MSDAPSGFGNHKKKENVTVQAYKHTHTGMELNGQQKNAGTHSSLSFIDLACFLRYNVQSEQTRNRVRTHKQIAGTEREIKNEHMHSMLKNKSARTKTKNLYVTQNTAVGDTGVSFRIVYV